MTNPLNRRDFLQTSLILSAAMSPILDPKITSDSLLASENSPENTLEKAASKSGASEKLRVAVIGVRGRGTNHIDGIANKYGCEVVTICDCDEGVIGKAMKAVEKKQGKAPQYVQDLRKVLDDKSIDIVTIATPNHWHSLAAIWALQAGKDVYVEKPVSHNVHEGAILVDTANKSKQICQAGTQSRSNPGMRQAIQWIHDGKIGKVTLSYGVCYKRRNSIGKVTQATPVPKTMNYDLWSGPAAILPVMRKNLHYDWHWIWAYGNGDLGNQGIHEMDKARWGLNRAGLPKSVISVGGRFGYIDDGQTANTQLCVFDYGDDAQLIFDVRGLPSVSPYPGEMSKAKPGSYFVGNIFYGTEGYVICPSYGSGIVLDKDLKIVKRFNGGSDAYHYENFIKAVRSRNSKELNGHIQEGHLSSALCHLGNISYQLGKETPMGNIDHFTDVKTAQDAFKRMVEHLKTNEIDTSKAIGKVGPLLTFDPKSNKFTGSGAEISKANDMLFAEYRKGFEVKETNA